MTFITSETTIEKYRKFKIESYTYLDGYSKGALRQWLQNFFKHIEMLIFGEKIDINDDTFF